MSLRDRVRSQLIQSLRAALRTLADITLEQQMVETFLHQLPTLSAADRSSLQAAIAQQAQQQAQQQAAQWTIRTTFPLTHDLQSRLVAGIQKQMPVAIPFENITFETYEDYPCGIELRTKGYKLAWHLEHYLDSLESQLSFALDQVPVL